MLQKQAPFLRQLGLRVVGVCNLVCHLVALNVQAWVMFLVQQLLALQQSLLTQQAASRRRPARCTVSTRQQQPLAAPLRPGVLTAALDLDETLVWCQQAHGAPGWMLSAALDPHNQDVHLLELPFAPDSNDCAAVAARKAPASTQSTQLIPSVHGNHQPGYAQIKRCPFSNRQLYQVLVVLRPGVRTFLQEATTFADLVLFTAAISEYAKPIVEQLLDPDGSIFQGRLLYREHVSMRMPATKGAAWHCIKDLTVLHHDLGSVVLVDNNPLSMLQQPSNGVPCQPFRGDPKDTHLSAVVLPLLRSLAFFPDVRPVLKARFQLGDWLRHKGYTPAAELDTTALGGEAVCKLSSSPVSEEASRQSDTAVLHVCKRQTLCGHGSLKYAKGLNEAGDSDFSFTSTRCSSSSYTASSSCSRTSSTAGSSRVTHSSCTRVSVPASLMHDSVVHGSYASA